MSQPSAHQPLDARRLPLHSVQLIEASAGTGKTYTITALYLRALLAVGREQPLGCEQILVVTFTEAATGELRDRIRRRIVEAREALLRGEAGDPLLAAILADSPLAREEQVARLEQAARQMDEAAIYTIHGFCWRMLTRNAFESGVLFSSEFTMDDRPLKYQAVKDFWRQSFYPLDPELAAIVGGLWKSPRALLADIEPMISAEDTRLLPSLEAVDLEAMHDDYRARLDRFKGAWLEAGGELEALIQGSGVSKNSYSKRYLPAWLNAVTEWARSESSSLPEKIDKFAQSMLIDKTPKGEPPRHPLFEQIDELLVQQPPYKALLRSQALAFVRHHLRQQKERQALMMPDDLLSRLAGALEGERAEELAARIRGLYPLALIDEFQDTDPLQYRIFSRLYGQGRDGETGLLMIGDPKQAIYSFRGADIFTYMQARESAQGTFGMETNWRSTRAMVDAVNALFGFSGAPFIYDRQIRYEPVRAAGRADQSPLVVAGQPLQGLCVWPHPAGDNPVPAEAIRQDFARATALEISRLLTSTYQGQACIGDRPLQPGDMAVLVRSRFEAALVRRALARQRIDSVFLSRDSVFSTSVAGDLLRLLMAVAEPTNERLFNAALATALLGYSAAELDRLTREESRWEAMQQRFIEARECWQYQGVLPMLHQLMRELGIAESQVMREEGERHLTDLLHLGELLQQASLEVEGEHGLLRWFAQQLGAQGEGGDEQQLRLESDRKLVKIVTIHSSKGLEYELVFLPFISLYRASRSGRYHEAGQRYWDLTDSQEAQEKGEQERLAEDLRLLYVALTRSIHACYLGIANVDARSRQRLAASAIGYLLNSAREGSLEEGLGAQLQRLQAFTDQRFGAGVLRIEAPPQGPIAPPQPPQAETEALSVCAFKGMVANDWRIGSYSALVAHGSNGTPVGGAWGELPGFDPELQTEARVAATEPLRLDAFSFPRGAQAGTFLHSLFENLDFEQAERASIEAMLAPRLQAEDYDPAWVQPLADWLLQVLACPLSGLETGFALRQLSTQRKRVEMEFLLPVASLEAPALNRLLEHHGHLPLEGVAPLQFQRLKGMLKGFIDLVFEHQGRYFVLDYKSNHLGDRAEDYAPAALEQAMLEHRYDLQSLIYTLALHRYLKTRLADYDYERHLGGCYYLFLRGMADGSGQQGIYYDQPDRELIAALDALLEGADD
ncbi:exodeoxyribonuclease V subunit beta [Aestuariirhabdus litorea]|uniref:RecBCD enzyme subunit RecB n=1 Tax=Aestuariirhabdus litorea TaxID=2528527 RepID=A0A3P3VWY3_9GAMM|nr:exodeoxyribonuclease V subunit beta [Aestuariirhabdus litorea]RRJ85213.1 exodeoxyribonuclease V subunit beta [Aestuariirhabdus litorea]RWW98434.1 exodeoxyribonuclease V subunit beta [Endozoicomonadaceae bacterium GTF-13]